MSPRCRRLQGGAHPLGELRVHHEVVHVFLSLGELQLPGHDGHHEGSAAGSLCGVRACQSQRQARLLQEALPGPRPPATVSFLVRVSL